MARPKKETKDFRVAVGAEPSDRPISPLRTDLRISPQLFYGELCFVIKDPVTLRYFRLQPIEHFLVTQFDGKKTARELLALLHQQFVDSALTVQDVLRFVGMLHESHLLVGEGIAHAEWLSKRAGASRKRRAMEAAQSFFFFKLPLFNPEKLLTFLENALGRVIFHPMTGLAALLLVVIAGIQVACNTDRFVTLPYNLLGWQNLVMLYCVFVGTKVFHEFGHGMAAKHFGGEVSQMGVMLFVFTPSFYCDTSDAWMIPSRAARLWINAGGIVVELVIAALASFAWLHTPGDSTLNQLAMNTMISCSVATIFFNANPLLKYDGYYFLADTLEIPNLFTKGRRFLSFFAQKYILGLKPTMPPDRRRLPWLVAYAICSGVYRWFVFFGIITLLYLMLDEYGLGPLGVLLAAAYVVMTVVWPTFKSARFLWKQRWDIYRRLAWVGLATGVCVGALTLVALLPWSHTIRAPLVVIPDQSAAEVAAKGVKVGESADETIIVQSPGYIAAVQADVGERVRGPVKDVAGKVVRQGDVIARMENPELTAQLAKANANRQEQMVLKMKALAENKTGLYSFAEGAIAEYDRQIKNLGEQIEALTIRAPIDGIVVSEQNLRQMVGNHMPVGRKLCRVIQPERLEAAISLPQSQASLVHEGMDVQIRLWSNPDAVITAKVLRVSPTVTNQLVHPALGNNVKGELAVVPNERGELRYTGLRSTVFVAIPQGAAFLADGMTGRGEIMVQRTQVYKRVWRMVLDSTTPDWHL